jgi:hypothetical protein
MKEKWKKIQNNMKFSLKILLIHEDTPQKEC